MSEPARPSLLLLRHAKSAWPEGVADVDRPLARRGERAAGQVGRFLLGNDLVPDRVVSSPARRARETAAVVLAAISDGAAGAPTATAKEPTGLPLVAIDERLYDGDALEAALEHLGGATRLLVVGHEPDLVDLVRALAGAEVRLPTAGLVWLEMAAGGGAAGASATVRLVLPPKLLDERL